MLVELGGGDSPREPRAINVDKREYDSVNLVADIENGIPIEDNTINRVYAYHILEHIVDLPHVLDEIHRILIPNGLLIGKVPHFRDAQAYHDPTHRQFFSCKTFDYWDRTQGYGKHFGYFNTEYKVLNVHRVRRVCFWKARPITFKLQAIK